MPCPEKRAHLLLTFGRTVVVPRCPFTIRLKDGVGGEVQPVRVKPDPGSTTAGIVVVTRYGFAVSASPVAFGRTNFDCQLALANVIARG
jgi:RRXRR protein